MDFALFPFLWVKVVEMRFHHSTLLICALLLGATPLFGQQAIRTEMLANGFTSPVLALSPPGDLERVFVVEQNGRIRIVENGSVLSTPFLDIQGQVRHSGEQGLLGLAFHPSYSQNGYFFVNYSNNSGNNVIARIQVSSNPNVADASTETQVISLNQPYSNHNGGMIAFGPNGYLWIGTGDGGSGGDPGNRAQNPQNLLGKMLRIDVDTLPYTIPPSNPFVSDAGTLDEIWALGVRNPWRFSFDKESGDLWIADVGQNAWEEINIEMSGDSGGRNYGWRLMEGNHCYNPSNCNQAGLTLPIKEYGHNAGYSITGGYAYRGGQMAKMHSRYFYADYGTNKIWSLRWDGTAVVDFQDHTSELTRPNGQPIRSISGFGQDGAGEVYICSLTGGQIFRIVPDGLSLHMSHMRGGSQAIASITQGTPSGSTFLTYSFVGLGQTPIPQLGITMDLANPTLFRAGRADGNGDWTLQGGLPVALTGRQIWIQALQAGAVSNVYVQVVD
jgi:glucose/arabinose dehydrogenase